MEGTFVTGIELLNQPQNHDTKPKQEEKPAMPTLLKGFTSKHTRSATAISKIVPPIKNDSFPQIQHNREPAAKSSRGLRSSASEVNLNKPLYKKLASVRDLYEKNKYGSETERVRENRPIVLLRGRKEAPDQRNYTHADAFNQKIVQRYDELYQSKKNAFENKSVENVAKRKHLFDEIEKQETKVQSEQKRYNNLTYEITKNEKILEKLRFQSEELDKKIEDNTNLEIVLGLKEKDLVECQLKVEIEEHNNECLKHMRYLKKELLLSIKKKCVQQQGMYEVHTEGIEHYLKDLKMAKELIKKGRFNIKEMKNNKNNGKENLIDPEFEEMLENEISEFEERRNLREILRHERVLEEELRIQQEEEERRIAFSKANKLREEENKRLQKEAEHEKELNKIKKLYYEFQKVTHVSRKDQLVEYYDGLEEKGEVLVKEIETMNETIVAKKEELEALRKQLKYKKFEEAKEPTDNFPQDIRIEDLEAILRDKFNEAIERENNMKKSEKLSYEVCTVISRILKQLQKSKTPTSVDKGNVVDLLSICGLKLERMLTVVIKKRKTFFIESINTDGTIKEGPPTYMNLVSDDVYNKSRKRFERDGPGGIEEEFDDGDL